MDPEALPLQPKTSLTGDRENNSRDSNVAVPFNLEYFLFTGKGYNFASRWSRESAGARNKFSPPRNYCWRNELTEPSSSFRLSKTTDQRFPSCMSRGE